MYKLSKLKFIPAGQKSKYAEQVLALKCLNPGEAVLYPIPPGVPAKTMRSRVYTHVHRNLVAPKGSKFAFRVTKDGFISVFLVRRTRW